MKKHKRKLPEGSNRFHIYARRRFPKLRGDPNNISIVRIVDHDEYHHFFGLKTPEEILDYLNEYFWHGRFDITISERR